MSSAHDSTPAPRLTGLQWMICAVAAIGFAFDIYELLMGPLVLREALPQMGLKPGTPDFNRWKGLMFWVPAMCGGFFGLIGGYLTDRLGRRRVLVWSILLYAGSAFAAAFSTNLTMLLILRSVTFVGVCVEFVAAVAWLSELFPNARQRESVLGYTQAFSSIGGLLVAGANYLAVHWGPNLPAIYGGHDAWRYTLISGIIPAIPLIIIRPFMPESPAWAAKKAAGTLKRPSIMELFAPRFRRTTVVTTLMFACSYGAAFGAIQQLPDIVPGLPGVREPGAAAQLEMKDAQAALKSAGEDPAQKTPAEERVKAAQKKIAQSKAAEQKIVANVQTWQEVGGLVGRTLLAFLAIRIVSRRSLLRVFQIPGLLIVPLVFFFPARNNLELLRYGIFVVGLLTVAQFSFWGNYLPRMYPTYLRGTGEGFAANVGGRMFGTSAALITTQLVNHVPGQSASERYAIAATIVGFSVYLIGSIACAFLPEPGAELPE
ncbi:MAG: MFS transporter [Planctomycetes bacterium]|nr:MFS transporter [Planctomycetota bacterium]